ncbi:MAG: ribonuclease P protein component [bacterium]|nr:ribonuclease P protein component [bacterium]
MLPKSQRLKTGDFKSMRPSRTVHTPHLLLRVFPAPTGTGKAAVIVSSATYKKAVDRNLLRRRVYRLIQKHHTLLSRGTVTVTVKKGALTLSFGDLERELCGAFPSP